jgi:hypothetical protein
MAARSSDLRVKVTRSATISRLTRIVALSVLPLTQMLSQQIVAGSQADKAARATSDSIGLSALNHYLSILPERGLRVGLTLGELRRLAPGVAVIGSSPMDIGVAMPMRPDSIDVGYIFSWNAGDVFDRQINDSSQVQRVDIFWEGRSLDRFRELAAKILTPLRSLAHSPACFDRSKSTSRDTVSLRKSYDIGWISNGWIGSMYVSGITYNGRTKYVLQYRAFVLLPEYEWRYVPARHSWDCFPDPDEIVRIVSVPSRQ